MRIIRLDAFTVGRRPSVARESSHTTKQSLAEASKLNLVYTMHELQLVLDRRKVGDVCETDMKDSVDAKLFSVVCALRQKWMETPILALAMSSRRERLALAKILSTCFGHQRCEPKTTKSLLTTIRKTTTFRNAVRLNKVFRRSAKTMDASSAADDLVDALRMSGSTHADAEACMGVVSLRAIAHRVAVDERIVVVDTCSAHTECE